MRALGLLVPLLGLLGCWAPNEALELEALDELDPAPARPGPLPQLADARQDAPEEAFVGIAAGGETLVLWTRRAVSVSHDEGQRFTTAIHTNDDIQAVTIADDGAVIAVDASGTITHGTQQHVLPTGGEGVQTEALLARGGRIVWLGEAGDDAPTLLLSEDQAATWRALPIPEDCTEAHDLGLSADGTLEFFGGCEAGCGGGYQFRYALTLPGERWEEVDWNIDSPADRYVGASGWAYGLGFCGADHGAYTESLCALSRERTAQVAPLSDLSAEPYPRLRAGASNVETDVMVVGDRLVIVHAGVLDSATVMAVPETTEIDIAIDDGGGIYGIIGGAAVRWDDGWRPMPVQAPE